TQHQLAAGGRPQPPSAQLNVHQDEPAYTQDAWAHWDATGPTVTFRCQCAFPQGVWDVLSWQVSPGWEVKDVTPLEGTSLRSWAPAPGGVLLVEPKTPWQAGQTMTAQIVL